MMFSNIKDKFITMFGVDAEHRYFNITNFVFILVIFLASFASLFHVRGFWLITNTPFWATILAVSTGLGIIGSMMAARYTLWTYASFLLIVIMELIGNIFDAFMNINVASQGFVAFKDLTVPLFDLIYLTEEGQVIPDIVYMRWIASIEGAFIPLLVVLMFHMWMKIRDSFKNPVIDIPEPESIEEPLEEPESIELPLEESIEDIPEPKFRFPKLHQALHDFKKAAMLFGTTDIQEQKKDEETQENTSAEDSKETQEDTNTENTEENATTTESTTGDTEEISTGTTKISESISGDTEEIIENSTTTENISGTTEEIIKTPEITEAADKKKIPKNSLNPLRKLLKRLTQGN